MEYRTRFGSLVDYEKGGVEVIDDDPRNYAFSNVFEVAAHAQPFEKVAVGKNRQYVLEAIRVEGTSPWRIAGHDEFALVMDGEVELRFLDPATPPANLPDNGSVPLDGDPDGTPMGRVIARSGHMTLLPAAAAYQFRATAPAVLLQQASESADTVYRWDEICQTA